MLLKKMAATVAALAMSGGVAAAAVATTDLNMRTGPGTENPVIAVIPDGAPVAVLGCDGGWCQVNYGGRVGFASAGYLSGEQGAVAVQAAPVYGGAVYGPGYYDYGYSGYGYYPGPSIGFSIGGHWRHGRNRHHGGHHGRHAHGNGSNWAGNHGGSVGSHRDGVRPRGQAMGHMRGGMTGRGGSAMRNNGPSGGVSAHTSGGGRAAVTVGRGGGGGGIHSGRER